MRIVEIRDLDGPNLFLMAPAIKVELGDIPEDQQPEVMARLSEAIQLLHSSCEVEVPEIDSRKMETPNHIVVAFSWNHRRFACKLGELVARFVIGELADLESAIPELQKILASVPEDDDAPLVIQGSDNRAPIVAVTGTNGKTTTSRLIDFVLRHAGYRVGLTSSAGVYIDNKLVLEGDYSGPSGARRVLENSELDFAVLETARGGLLLRGSGYMAADVAVITNVTEDHLGLHGIHTIDGLAEVKAIIARNVKPGGFCVLNARNEYTLAMKNVTAGIPVLFDRDPESEIIRSHVDAGGTAINVDANNNIVWYSDGAVEPIMSLEEIPMTFGGKAPHQVENAVAAIAALIGLGIPMKQIGDGVAAFKSTAENSKGRLNIFAVREATVIIDFAHNEAGLANLLEFGRNYLDHNGRLIAVIGTAGDRDNQSLRAIARCAVESADLVVLKDSVKYLRGREPGEMLDEMRAAVKEVDRPEVEILESPDERNATFMMVDQLQPGDVLAIMCIEDLDYILEELGKIGEVVA